MQSKEFKTASNDFIIWLNAVEDRLSSQPSVTSDTESIREFKKDHVPLYEEIQQHEPVLSAIKKSADKFLQSAEPGKERDRVEQKLTRIQSRWEEVQKNASDRKSLLEEIEPVAQQYRESLHDIISWLNAAEKNMVLLKYAPCDTKGAQKYEELLKEMESSLEKQQSSLGELDHFTRSLMEFQPVDANFVSSQVQDVKNRFATLDSGLKEKASNLEKIKQLLEDFTERVHALEELVVQGMILCAYRTPFMDAEKISGELEMITEILDAFTDRGEELDLIESVAMNLVDKLEVDAPDSAIIRNQVETLNTRFRGIMIRLEKRQAQLDRHQQHLLPFRSETKRCYPIYTGTAKRAGIIIVFHIFRTEFAYYNQFPWQKKTFSFFAYYPEP
ncbi:PREDICTED: microtubule-actin cross-linking factor 1-like [Acropora digitifera]|uniref:microtubule-actin cross-linking factor 1-like n=1 Tax=Acropora digitifera TaxID=70779 RepID=UPI00077A7DB1|nr:PREDICTED: microtubule-actin cross-linking factor 1-like [Acropora digitifera]